MNYHISYTLVGPVATIPGVPNNPAVVEQASIKEVLAELGVTLPSLPDDYRISKVTVEETDDNDDE